MTYITFPPASTPAHYKTVRWNGSGDKKSGVHYPGNSVNIRFDSASAATAYTVRDYSGAVVTSGTLSGSTTSFTVTPPPGGWKLGWYRIYGTGPNVDSIYGNSYFVTNFVFINSDSRFKTMPAGNVGIDHQFQNDLITKGIMGMGTSRHVIQDAANPTANSPFNIASAVTAAVDGRDYWTAPGAQYLDGVRSLNRYMWVTFPNGAVDAWKFGRNSDNYLYGSVYPATTALNGANLYVEMAAGTNPNTRKITVFYPDSTTLVETFDNIPEAFTNAQLKTQINNVSTYIRAYIEGNQDNTIPKPTVAKSAVGVAKHDGVALTVSTLYPEGFTHFEGPHNEINMRNQGWSEQVAHMMRLFQKAVHDGNASAKAIGPTPVSIDHDWRYLFNAGLGTYCDEFAVHMYNNPRIPSLSDGRTDIQTWKNQIADYGFSSKKIHNTESNTVLCQEFGLYRPRRASFAMMLTLLFEQYGIPHEQAPPWYDVSHGFWSFPGWWMHSDRSLNPQVPMYRTYSAEVWGQNYESSLNFGTVGNQMFLGNVYSGASAKTVVMMAASYMSNSSVTLSVTGTSSQLQVIDCFGNGSAAAVANGKTVVPVSNTPVYVRLPVGATVSVNTVNDWPTKNMDMYQRSAVSSVGTQPPAVTVSSAFQSADDITDGDWMKGYPGENNTWRRNWGIYDSANSVPENVLLTWDRAVRVDRVVIFAFADQVHSTLLDFDVQTSPDGTTWTTQATVNKLANAVSFKHGSSGDNAGCQRDTYWDAEWIIDVPFLAPVTAKAIRLVVRRTSFGGNPIDISEALNGVPGEMGQGTNGVEKITLQEIVVLCGANHVAST